MTNKETSNIKTTSSLLENEEQLQDSDLNLFICENTDGILDPLEQITYALNETQIRYGSVVVLKNAP
jgi:hypothetical protein